MRADPDLPEAALGHGTPSPASRMQMRVLPSKPVLTSASLSSAPHRESAEVSPGTTSFATPRLLGSETTRPTSSRQAARTPPDSVAIAVPQGEDQLSEALGNKFQDEFVPRPLLTVPPVALESVILVAPQDQSQIVRHVAVLSLFIDEEGQVLRISASEPMLPPAFEQAAREAFIAARFAPGQLNGIPVKSRVRVEVVFDNTPQRE